MALTVGCGRRWGCLDSRSHVGFSAACLLLFLCVDSAAGVSQQHRRGPVVMSEGGRAAPHHALLVEADAELSSGGFAERLAAHGSHDAGGDAQHRGGANSKQPIATLGGVGHGYWALIAIFLCMCFVVSTLIVFLTNQESTFPPATGPVSVGCCICCTPFALLWPVDEPEPFADRYAKA
eukprot:TRINITY_DN79987_c0_g1_i1.p1 TRINITY_DN79987_c0_g1~~TRINITY_DN79987_c0_g1_i1.p1  ORF type:complete len:179 (+),score=26.08 TRINITY_DN79987_c0_g1_i1:54-590(+)